MRLSAAPASALSSATPLLVLLVDSAARGKLPGGALGARAATLIRGGAFKAEPRKTLLLHAESRGGARVLLLIGMGKAADLSAEDFRRAGAIAGSQAAELGAGALVLGTAGAVDFDSDRLQAAGEGLVLSGYRYPGKQDAAASTPPKKAAVASSVRGAAAVLAAAQALGEGANLVRELGDLPGNTVTPRHLARTAQAVARKGRLRCRVHGRRDLQRMKMGGILAVNQGSAEEPFLIEMEYVGARPKATLCIVGKGLTFDSGGISLKPADKMEDMKYDMCGGAATIGLMQALAVLRPPGLRVIGIVGTTDNMPGPSAYKPGDVVRTASGKTIEVINTDA
ncbi:MAG TPA: M17 family peptidase N-terminal domain-containing protein, partial [Planctomycetota bacterium]|nr:M17 family peptidase N-terminal domain-containing protein [Planctomycetota bacterium]